MKRFIARRQRRTSLWTSFAARRKKVEGLTITARGDVAAAEKLVKRKRLAGVAACHGRPCEANARSTDDAGLWDAEGAGMPSCFHACAAHTYRLTAETGS